MVHAFERVGEAGGSPGGLVGGRHSRHGTEVRIENGGARNALPTGCRHVDTGTSVMERGRAEEEGSHALWAKRTALVGRLVGDHAAAGRCEGVRVVVVAALQVGVSGQAGVTI